MRWFLNYIEWQPSIVPIQPSVRCKLRYQLFNKLVGLTIVLLLLFELFVFGVLFHTVQHAVLFALCVTLTTAVTVTLCIQLVLPRIGYYVESRYPYNFGVSK